MHTCEILFGKKQAPEVLYINKSVSQKSIKRVSMSKNG